MLLLRVAGKKRLNMQVQDSCADRLRSRGVAVAVGSLKRRKIHRLGGCKRPFESSVPGKTRHIQYNIFHHD